MKLSKKAILIGGASLGIIVALITTFLIINSTRSREITDANTPSFSTILPAGKSIATLGGWNRISPPENEPVFAYSDEIDSVSVSVSQQLLPTDISSDAATQVSEMAKKFNATRTIDAGPTKVYIGTSAKGPQSVIFTKDGLLVLIKSQQKIDDAAWKDYVVSLS